MREERLATIGRDEGEHRIASPDWNRPRSRCACNMPQQPRLKKHTLMCPPRSTPRGWPYGVEDARAAGLVANRPTPCHPDSRSFETGARPPSDPPARISIIASGSGIAGAIGDAQLEVQPIGRSARPDDGTEVRLAARTDIEKRPTVCEGRGDERARRVAHVRCSNGVDCGHRAARCPT
jgi:hypothetical protein